VRVKRTLAIRPSAVSPLTSRIVRLRPLRQRHQTESCRRRRKDSTRRTTTTTTTTMTCRRLDWTGRWKLDKTRCGSRLLIQDTEYVLSPAALTTETNCCLYCTSFLCHDAPEILPFVHSANATVDATDVDVGRFQNSEHGLCTRSASKTKYSSVKTPRQTDRQRQSRSVFLLVLLLA
jgi:hypothetical protein